MRLKWHHSSKGLGLSPASRSVAHSYPWEAKTKAKRKSRKHRSRSQSRNPAANAKGSLQHRRSRRLQFHSSACVIGSWQRTRALPVCGGLFRFARHRFSFEERPFSSILIQHDANPNPIQRLETVQPERGVRDQVSTNLACLARHSRSSG